MGPGSDEIDEIRREIDESRANLGEAVGALAYKADVKNRAPELIAEKKEAVVEKIDELKSKAPGGGAGSDAQGGFGDKVKDRLPSGDAVGEKLDALKSEVPDGVGDAKGRLDEATPSGEDVKRKAQGAAETAKGHPAAVAGGAAVAGLAAGLALPETDLEREKLKPHAQEARAELTDRVQETVEQVKSGAQDAAGSVADAVKEQGSRQDGRVGEMAEKAADKTQQKVRQC